MDESNIMYQLHCVKTLNRKAAPRLWCYFLTLTIHLNKYTP